MNTTPDEAVNLEAAVERLRTAAVIDHLGPIALVDEVAVVTPADLRTVLFALSASNARALAAEKALRLVKERLMGWPIDDFQTCMCGSAVEGHDIGSGHSPVSQADHAIRLIVEDIDATLASMKEEGRE